MLIVRKAMAAVLLISLGVYGLLAIENSYVAALLFTLGLLTICQLRLSLFTGQCGFILETGAWAELGRILLVNLLGGYLLGLTYSSLAAGFSEAASLRMATWSLSLPYFLKSVLCGVIMFAAVRVEREGNHLGIIMGVPLFILCGFQHCIANVIVMGVAHSFHPALLLCVLGNFAGSLLSWYLMPQQTGAAGKLSCAEKTE